MLPMYMRSKPAEIIKLSIYITYLRSIMLPILMHMTYYPASIDLHVANVYDILPHSDHHVVNV